MGNWGYTPSYRAHNSTYNWRRGPPCSFWRLKEIETSAVAAATHALQIYRHECNQVYYILTVQSLSLEFSQHDSFRMYTLED